MFQTRILIESELCHLAATATTPVVLDGLQAAARAFEDGWQSGDLVAHVEADLAFHLDIVTACPNQMLAGLYRAVQQLLTETQRQPIPNTNPDRMRRSIGDAHPSPEHCRVGGGDALTLALVHTA
ncbi:FCD domain-containing protein [Paracoccus sp. S3-43]|uniref:FadR/GntR family transcriptional regulator n=1 Tax=Paracoccus sp. S3-43 TaxID=3030011 RepID=UPI0023AE9266|nr:FCD domain-containing protein [Paracoccus sp. S3-43]WEF24541.1 FCD domain-containing protein [Paracoccus sp. S3-43]